MPKLRFVSVASAVVSVIFALGTGGHFALAQQLNLDELAKRPGFTVTKKTVNGEEIVEIRKATVTIEMSRAGTIGTDSDSAVLCVWDIYITEKLGADYCYPDSEHELKEDMTDALERLKDFIVANSISPVTRAELDASVQRKFTQTFAKPPNPPNAERCREHFQAFISAGRESRRAALAKILAVPRPPVLNPCI
jgi:hypothetical protein